MGNVNKHIEDYLDYYLKLPDSPEYAVLVKGVWGVGKTWFIKHYLEKLDKPSEKSSKKFVHISLYGITSYDEIENIFFTELNPLLSSKGVRVTGKLLKTAIEMSGASIGSLKAEISKYLTDTAGLILVFDDLERCSINIADILGYINHFVEYGGYKVIILANEDEIIEREENKKKGRGKDDPTFLQYERIKEKLIGETFEVEPDFDNSFVSFVTGIVSEDAKKLFDSNKEEIKSLYLSSKYKNLRLLKHALWGFERLFNALSTEAKKKSDLLLHLLQLYLVYSFEIKSGSIKPNEISMIRPFLSVVRSMNRADGDELDVYKKLSTKYKDVDFYEEVIKLAIWESIFSKGALDTKSINESISSSRYFFDEKTPAWRKLWGCLDLTDEEFGEVLPVVEKEFKNREHKKVGIVKHITGAFLWLSDKGLYDLNKEEILKASKVYIDDLSNKGLLAGQNASHVGMTEDSGWGGAEFFARDMDEFKEFSKYVDDAIEKANEASMPAKGEKLLEIMKGDTNKFFRMLILNNHKDNIYYAVPILKYVGVNKFVECFLSLTPEGKRTVGYVFKSRYEFGQSLIDLKSECDFLTEVSKKLVKKEKELGGKVSGYLIGEVRKEWLDKAIERLSSTDS